MRFKRSTCTDHDTNPWPHTFMTFLPTDLETFMTLAKGYIYVFEGRDRTEICAYNSGVKLFVVKVSLHCYYHFRFAFAAGHELLLGATFTK